MPETTSSEGLNYTASDVDLFTWHGTELIFIPLMIVFGVLGNLIVFYIYHFRWRSDIVTLVKRMLAGLDCVCLIVAMPIILHLVIYPRSPHFVPLCRFSSFVALTTSTSSAFVLLFIAVDRYLKLSLLRKKGLTSSLVKKLFVAGCTLSVLINTPTLWLFGRDNIDFFHYHVRSSYCFIDSNRDNTLFAVWSVAIGLAFVFNTNMLMYLYSKVVRTLRELSKKHDELKRRPSLAASASAELLQKQKRSQVMRMTAIVFIAITVVYFCSYAPYFITLVLSMTDPTIEGSMSPPLKAIYDLCKLSPLINNVANPIIYSFTSERFTKELKKIVTFKFCQKDAFRRRADSTMSRQEGSAEMSESRLET